jgi:tryptophanyl-tRNA synthetase
MAKEYRVLTGDRPTGRLHLGHYVGSLQNRVALQNRTDVVSRMYMVADIQALTDNYDNPQKVRDNVMQVVLDNLSVGLDPTKTAIFIQSQIPQIAELTVLFLNLVTVNRLMQNPTVKTEIEQKFVKKIYDEGSNEELEGIIVSDFLDHSVKAKEVDNTLSLVAAGFSRDRELIKKIASDTIGEATTRLNIQTLVKGTGVPAGFLCYPVSQAADILFGLSNLIPVGADQRPMIEQTNEIAKSFNRIYKTDLFPHVEIMVGETGRLVGTDGNAKMSKSLGNTIYLSDDADTVAMRVRGMYTCPSKVSVSDTVSDDELAGNTVFQYLDIFDTDISFVADLKRRYQNGLAGDSEGKKRLTEVLNTLLEPIRERRALYAADMAGVEEIVRAGTEYAKSVAEITMKRVRSAMHIDYFE